MCVCVCLSVWVPKTNNFITTSHFAFTWVGLDPFRHVCLSVHLSVCPSAFVCLGLYASPCLPIPPLPPWRAVQSSLELILVSGVIVICHPSQSVEATSSQTDTSESPTQEQSSSTTSSVATSTSASSTVTECHTTLSAVHLGRLLLQKMGWKEGEGLGKDSSGPTAPLVIDMKKDRKGLNSALVFGVFRYFKSFNLTAAFYGFLKCRKMTSHNIF